MPLNSGSEEPPARQESAIAALLVTIVVLVAIVALFLLLKFNPFNGGASNNVQSTLMAAPVLPARS